MKQIKLSIPLLIIFMIFTNCQKDSILDNQSEFLDSQKELKTKKHPVPFHASFISTVLIFPPNPNPEVCDGQGPPVFNLLQSLEGNATHMGNITGSISSCVNFVTGQIFNAEVTFVAANGDELYFEGSGNIGDSFDITGGTGRFEDATGSVTGTFELIPGSMPPMFNSEMHGEIQY